MFNIHVFSFNPLQENTYLLLTDKKECIVVDPGCYFEEERQALNNFLTKNDASPKLLLNTHCHLDHVFGNKFIRDTYGLALHIHPDEKPILDYAPTSALMWNLPFDNYQGPIEYLRNEQLILFGKDKLEVLLTPGHAPGHVCFYCEKQGFVIGGDVLFRESIGRTDLPGGDHPTLLKSIREQLFTLPDETIVYPGHGPSTTIEYEKKYNPYLSQA